MALVKCPECKKEVSDSTKVCIHCGYKLKNGTPFYKTKLATKVRPFVIAFLVICMPLLILSMIITRDNFNQTMKSYYGTTNYSCNKYAQNNTISNEYLYDCSVSGKRVCLRCKKDGAFVFYRVHGCTIKSESSCREYAYG